MPTDQIRSVESWSQICTVTSSTSFPEHSKNCGRSQDDGYAQLKYVGVAPKTYLLLVRRDPFLKGWRENRSGCSAHLLKVVVRQGSIYFVPFDYSRNEEHVQTNQEDGNHDGANKRGISVELHVLAERQTGESGQRRPQSERYSPLEFPSFDETCPSHVTKHLQFLKGRVGRLLVTEIRLHLHPLDASLLDDTKGHGFAQTAPRNFTVRAGRAIMTQCVSIFGPLNSGKRRSHERRNQKHAHKSLEIMVQMKLLHSRLLPVPQNWTRR